MKRLEQTSDIDQIKIWIQESAQEEIDFIRAQQKALRPNPLIDKAVDKIIRGLTSVQRSISGKENYRDITEVLRFSVLDQFSYLTNQEIGREFAICWNNVLGNIQCGLEEKITAHLILFHPSKIVIAIAIHSDIKSCINFLQQQINRRRSSNGKRKFLREIQEAILNDACPFFRLDTGWEYFEFYKSTAGQPTLIQFNYVTLLSWVDANLKHLSSSLEFNLPTESIYRIGFLLADRGIVHFNAAIPANGSAIFNEIMMSQDVIAIQDPDGLVAVVAWLHENGLMTSSSTQIIEWLEGIGIADFKRFCSRSLWTKLKNKFWAKTILNERGINLAAILAVVKVNIKENYHDSSVFKGHARNILQ